jgi:hypothetical protein
MNHEQIEGASGETLIVLMSGDLPACNAARNREQLIHV